MQSTRTPWQVTRSVWHAMFIREALARTMADRMAWFWMLFEPIAMIVVMVLIRTVIMGNMRHIDGAELIPWMITGLFGFYLVRENMMRPIGAIDANKGLFSYRQVKPIDPVFVRCYLEGLLRSFVFILFIVVGTLLDVDLVPAEPLAALGAWFSLWCLGLGAGLVFSALAGLVPEIGKILRIISMPLLIISGVIVPLNFVPHDLLVYVMWNPIVHGLETLRATFFPLYRPVHGTSLLYLWYWALAMITLGLMLHVRFELRLKRQ
ncbi:ABC transporter permease [Marinobacterium lutimaris]|uniref:Capsular polysaccharide transport system permease protein n=1 Tax=Marinobacterium lutimaris TaxID=568106 RepID=A0A1H6B2R9_9GAMM|nr:ABC transporter permease [Marinobacterium lutimaris]SEG55148.1 capsular polysaccharide transport system permease protein [Marinobacterium lutimaris]